MIVYLFMEDFRDPFVTRYLLLRGILQERRSNYNTHVRMLSFNISLMI